MTLSEISKLPIKPPSLAPKHKLTIAGNVVSSDLKSASIVYTSDGGSSGSQLTLDGNYKKYNNAEVKLYLGYGDDLVPYMIGRMQRPHYNTRLNTTQTNVFGAFKLMDEQILKTEETYAGRSLQYALQDLTVKAGYKRGQAEIRGGDNFIIEHDEVFPFNNTLSDTANSLMEKAGFIGMDQPEGKRLFRKKPRVGVVGRAVETYTSAEIPLDGFELPPKSDVTWYGVIVQRVAADGTQLGLHYRDVKAPGDFPPPSHRIYVVEDYYGTQGEAEQETEDIARYLRLGDFGFSLTVPMNPTLKLFDTVTVTIQHRGLRYKYTCLISGDINVDYTPNTRTSPGIATMSISGDALVVEDGVKIG